MPDSLAVLLRQKTAKLLHDNPQLTAITQNQVESGLPLEKNWFDFVTQVSNGVLSSFANRMMDHVSGANFFNILQTVGSAAGFYSMMAPYFISFVHFVKEKGCNSEMLQRFRVESPIVESSNVAYFTDTFFDINDIAITLQQHVASATQNEKEITVMICDDQNRQAAANIKTFQPVGVY